jgi:hypothetical protein
MSYNAIPQSYRNLIDRILTQITDEQKHQLGEIWRLMLQDPRRIDPHEKFSTFLNVILNESNLQNISDHIDWELSLLENEEGLVHLIDYERLGGKTSKKRKSYKKRKGKSFRKNNRSKNNKSYKKRKLKLKNKNKN